VGADVGEARALLTLQKSWMAFCREEAVAPALVCSIIEQVSQWQPECMEDLLRGLMQITPEDAQSVLQVSNILEPAENIRNYNSS
jgi:membrane-bound lytic murein transglycosylase MltF